MATADRSADDVTFKTVQARVRDGNVAAVSAVQQATTGTGPGLKVASDNADTAAVIVRGAGTLLDLQDTSGASQFSVSNEGNLTYSGTTTATGNQTINGDLTVNGGAVFNEASADEDFRVESNGDANMLFVDGGNDRVGIGTATPSERLDVVGGNVSITTAGNGLHIATGDNARMGSAVLVGGTVTVANTSVTANTLVFLSRSTTGGTEGTLSTTQIASTSFTINSSSGTDTSTVNWLLIEPA